MGVGERASRGDARGAVAVKRSENFRINSSPFHDLPVLAAYLGGMRKNVLVVLALLVFTSAAFAASGPFSGKVAFTSDRDGNFEIYASNRDGSSPTRLTNNPASDQHPAWSPDGKKIAFTSDRDGNDEIYVMNANGTGQTRITNNAASDSEPTWSPDGAQIVFVSTRLGGFDIFRMNAAGNGIVQLTNVPAFNVDPAFSPKGDKIVFASSRDGNFEIYSMNPDGSAQTRLTNNTLFDVRPDISPNGQKIVYSSNVPTGSGFSQQVVIMDANGANQTVLTSDFSNGNPTFGADGKRIFFNSTRDINTEVYSMALDGSDAERLSKNNASDATPSVQRIFQVESIGIYRPSTGKWLLRNTNTSGTPDVTFTFGGQPGDLPVPGNWNGDERTDLGIYRDGSFIQGIVQSAFGATFVIELPPIQLGTPGDLPIAGDWDGDGIDDLGVYRPSTGTFLIRKKKSTFPFFQFISFSFGQAGDLPVAGDWNGDGIETPGVFHPDFKLGQFQLTDGFDSSVELSFGFGNVQQPVAGDWLGVGVDNVGLFDPTVGFFLSTTFTSDVAFAPAFGQPGDLPVAGNWTP